MRPLAGLLVVDLTRLLPGPFATQLLADLGARVVKIEEPDLGDYARWMPPEVEGHGHAFTAINRGKESVALDLKDPEAQEALRRLVAMADVLVESFRPGVLARLGLAPDALLAANPRLVVASMSGYGATGPLAEAPGHDLNYQALAGIVALNGDARPLPPAAQTADMAGALYAVVAILAALRERDRSGRGRVLDLALYDAAVAVNVLALERARAGDAQRLGESELAGALPAYGVYEASDGGHVALAALEGKFWERFARAVGREDWIERHLDRSDAFRADVAAVFRTRPRDVWVDLLVGAGVPATPVLAPGEALAHPHARARGVGSPGAPLGLAPRGRAPTLGEHTEKVLREAGLEGVALDRLLARASVRASLREPI
ncbi:MAG TPA: CaiB/BaiF CoA-transferase family protein [Candidatus Thermoplasmatota archaeon]|nr:CaiB/BaiF CoA-transferase family protein [Candidatus Thermoplasmatota archaeon]